MFLMIADYFFHLLKKELKCEHEWLKNRKLFFEYIEEDIRNKEGKNSSESRNFF